MSETQIEKNNKLIAKYAAEEFRDFIIMVAILVVLILLHLGGVF